MLPGRRKVGRRYARVYWVAPAVARIAAANSPARLLSLRSHRAYPAEMRFRHTLRGRQFAFADLRELLAKANEEKSGDQLAGIAAESDQERVAAKWALADVTLQEIVEQPLIDPD